MKPDLPAYIGRELAAAYAARESLADALLAGGYPPSLEARVACVTLLAGSGSRWVESIREARAAGIPVDFDEAKPRGLFPVRNLMGEGPERLPIASYALRAVRGLGRSVIVTRGFEAEIESSILRPLGYRSGAYAFREQAVRDGKPRGHGDAAFQCMDLWSDKEYVIFNFGGDASNPLTAALSLAFMAALDAGGAAPALLLPVTRKPSPAYPIRVDGEGRPLSFGHAKLKAAPAGADARPEGVDGLAYTNVGVRIYRAAELAEAITELRSRFWTAERGYALPGNDPAGGEFALDNVDEYLAERGRARLLYVARPEELSPVKSLSDVPRFEADIAAVYRDCMPGA
jgi:hypothetical protein